MVKPIQNLVHNPLSCPVPRRLKAARLKLNLSQRSLGIAAGIDEASASARMNQYERGKHVPDYATLCRLVSTLGTPLLYFYADNDDEAELLLNLAALSSEQQILVRDLIRRINFNP